MALTFALPGCDGGSPESDPVLVRAGEDAFRLSDLQARWATGPLAGLPDASGQAPPALVRAALSERAVEAALAAEARARGAVPNPAEVRREAESLRAADPAGLDTTLAGLPGGEPAWLRFLGQRMARERVEQAVKRELRGRIVPDPAAVAARVEASRERGGGTTPLRVRAAQVLTRTRGEAEVARSRLLSGEPPSAVARETSIGPEAPSGGDLGWRAAGSLPPFLDAALFALELGGVSEVVESPFGFHVLVAVERDPGGPVDPGRLVARAAEEVAAEALDRAWAAWLAERMRASGVSATADADRVRCCAAGRLVLAAAPDLEKRPRSP